MTYRVAIHQYLNTPCCRSLYFRTERAARSAMRRIERMGLAVNIWY